ncbi:MULTISPECIES: hypothetical protein [unclassified Streptomyces]|uniref:hypothetical protein n=1 Tax=unclassified Streptomyces TaxID=2593676 RepID=UPI002E7FDD3C|nr:hypothetical protein [Streptomyces sp. NBC_00562]WTC77221.1 hypothetical protein OH719_04395 [Streptomyces sp. NBC_01653]WTD38263.1 hypothetical protein OHB03_42465 [Streptomyces sp. NBC_01643]WTD93640.1 hypothetical protein OG891_42465 [Streptomyces sp. NBC_01637]WTF25569.1 hypothetical protein OG955_04610 [Streptomyces sp. NBC_01602]WUC24597.1 hypothetical protein OHA33_40740 [Streptomyces sp. NBC_00562]
MDEHGRVRASQTLPACGTLTAGAVLHVTSYFRIRMADFNCAVTVLGDRDNSTVI